MVTQHTIVPVAELKLGQRGWTLTLPDGGMWCADRIELHGVHAVTHRLPDGDDRERRGVLQVLDFTLDDGSSRPVRPGATRHAVLHARGGGQGAP